MASSSCALRHIASVMALPLLALPLSASGAADLKARSVARVAAPIRADTSIIPLPLTPVIPVGQRLCAAHTPAGLGYTMLRPAPGAKPVQSDVVLINYIGYLAATGVVFDQGQRSPLEVSGVIPGFSQALQMLAKNGIARFCIPAAQGYGAQGAGPIPANADLVFQIELLDFRPATGGQAATPDASSPAPQAGATSTP
jgi:FKBP-type peptidyl-prolyl cis-trans isomerase FkpA